EPKRSGAVLWPGEAPVTFSDARISVRCWLWSECVFPEAGDDGGLATLPEPVRAVPRAALTAAAETSYNRHQSSLEGVDQLRLARGHLPRQGVGVVVHRDVE